MDSSYVKPGVLVVVGPTFVMLQSVPVESAVFARNGDAVVSGDAVP